eukprot:5106717-Pyramimonas_sp.AAC.1
MPRRPGHGRQPTIAIRMRREGRPPAGPGGARTPSWQACALALAKRRKRRDLVSMPRGNIRRCALGRAGSRARQNG